MVYKILHHDLNVPLEIRILKDPVRNTLMEQYPNMLAIHERRQNAMQIKKNYLKIYTPDRVVILRGTCSLRLF